MATINMDVTEYNRMLDLEKVLKQTIEDSNVKHKQILELTKQLEEEKTKNEKELLVKQKELIADLEKKSKGVTQIIKRTVLGRHVNEGQTLENFKKHSVHLGYKISKLMVEPSEFNRGKLVNDENLREVTKIIIDSIVIEDSDRLIDEKITITERNLEDFKEEFRKEYLDKYGKGIEDEKVKLENNIKSLMSENIKLSEKYNNLEKSYKSQYGKRLDAVVELINLKNTPKQLKGLFVKDQANNMLNDINMKLQEIINRLENDITKPT